MDAGDRAGYLEEPDASAAAAANEYREEGNSATRKKSGKRWNRAAIGTRDASKRAEAAARQEEASASGNVVSISFERDSLNYGQDTRSGKRDGWEKAIQDEIDALEANEGYTITKRTPGTHALHNKWVYKTKTDAQGDLNLLKRDWWRVATTRCSASTTRSPSLP